DILYRLLSAGYERWGQLRGLIRDGDPSVADLDAHEIARIRLRAEAVSAWKQAWSIGRGQPVDSAVLERSGAVSDKFMDEVSALVERHDRDGAALVRALRDGEVTGFYTKKMNELESWLTEHGYIDESGTLSPDEIWTSTVQAVSAGMTEFEMTIDDLKRLIGRVTGLASRPARTEAPSEA
ncbi:MAG: hypothetical protein HKN17_08175, partial [Rhodothermales bacterium]|nr:hypothetical protein [Rhodothermales bacterium]